MPFPITNNNKITKELIGDWHQCANAWEQLRMNIHSVSLRTMPSQIKEQDIRNLLASSVSQNDIHAMHPLEWRLIDPPHIREKKERSNRGSISPFMDACAQRNREAEYSRNHGPIHSFLYFFVKDGP